MMRGGASPAGRPGGAADIGNFNIRAFVMHTAYVAGVTGKVTW